MSIIFIFIGIIIALFAVHAVNMYQMRKQTMINTKTIAEVVTFINNSLKQSQPRPTPAPAPVAPTPDKA